MATTMPSVRGGLPQHTRTPRSLTHSCTRGGVLHRRPGRRGRAATARARSRRCAAIRRRERHKSGWRPRASTTFRASETPQGVTCMSCRGATARSLTRSSGGAWHNRVSTWSWDTFNGGTPQAGRQGRMAHAGTARARAGVTLSSPLLRPSLLARQPRALQRWHAPWMAMHLGERPVACLPLAPSHARCTQRCRGRTAK